MGLCLDHVTSGDADQIFIKMNVYRVYPQA